MTWPNSDFFFWPNAVWPNAGMTWLMVSPFLAYPFLLVGCWGWFWTLLPAPDPPTLDRPKFRSSFSLSLGVFSLNFGVFEAGPSNVHVWAILRGPTLRVRFFLFLGPTLWSATMTHTRSRNGLAKNGLARIGLAKIGLGQYWFGPKPRWPKMDWPKLVKSGWPERDWRKSVSSAWSAFARHRQENISKSHLLRYKSHLFDAAVTLRRMHGAETCTTTEEHETFFLTRRD